MATAMNADGELPRVPAECDHCGEVDTDPKLHYGAQTYHHDCVPRWVMRDLTEAGYYDSTGAWHADPDAEWTEPVIKQVEMTKAVIEAAQKQKPKSQNANKGEQLLATIRRLHGQEA